MKSRQKIKGQGSKDQVFCLRFSHVRHDLFSGVRSMGVFGPHVHYSGFTLIEIILVVLLVTVIIGLTVPNFSSAYNNLQLQNTTDHLAYLMRYAQGRAVTHNREVRLEFDEEHLHYWLTEQEEMIGASEAEKTFNQISGRLGRMFVIPKDIEVRMEAMGISFYPDGRIEKDHIYLCYHDRCYLISTKERRGYVQIYEAEAFKG